MNQELPSAIFYLCEFIPINHTIYISQRNNEHRFGGIRDKNEGFEDLIFRVPNNKNPEKPNKKKITIIELDKLWCHLVNNKSIETQNFKILCSALYNRGSCCVGAFFGIINYLFPNVFIKVRGKIYIKEELL